METESCLSRPYKTKTMAEAEEVRSLGSRRGASGLRLAMTGKRYSKGRPWTQARTKVSVGKKPPSVCTLEISAESKLSCPDRRRSRSRRRRRSRRSRRRSCEADAVDNPDSSLISIDFLGSRGTDPSVYRRGKITAGSRDGTVSCTPIPAEVNGQDVTSHASGRRSLSPAAPEMEPLHDPGQRCFYPFGLDEPAFSSPPEDLACRERLTRPPDMSLEEGGGGSRPARGPGSCPPETETGHRPDERHLRQRQTAGYRRPGKQVVAWVASLLLLLLPTLVAAQAETRPSLATPLQNLTVAAGRRATLTCIVENLGNYKVAWMHYGLTGRAVLTVGTVVITKNPRVSLLEERAGASWSLVITNVTTTDHGHYLCQVNTVPPEKLYFHISVLVAPRIVRPPEDVAVTEGDDVVMECDATGDPQPILTWRREADTSPPRNHSHVVEAGGRRLQLASVGREDSGAFLCVASNGVPPAVSARVQVSVKFAPEMSSVVGVVWAEVGGRAALVCSYQAWPAPTVTWTKDGTTIAGSSEEWEARGSGTSTMVLDPVDSEDFGHYCCVVSNPLGTNSSLMSLVELTTTTTTTLEMMTAPPGDDQHRLEGQVAGKALEKKTSLKGEEPSSSSSPASSWQRTTSPIEAGPTDASPHRYVQDAAPPSDPRPRPLYPEATSASASVSRLLHQTVYCLNLLSYLLALLR